MKQFAWRRIVVVLLIVLVGGCSAGTVDVDQDADRPQPGNPKEKFDTRAPGKGRAGAPTDL